MTFASRSGIFTSYTGTDAGNGLLYAPIYTDTDLTLPQAAALPDHELDALLRREAGDIGKECRRFDGDSFWAKQRRGAITQPPGDKGRQIAGQRG